MKSRIYTVLISVPLLTSLGCDTSEDVLAPYAGDRPLILLRVTQSHAPEIQWVGGRVAAVGVNRGPTAALDSTLVWLFESDSDDISSPVRIGPGSRTAFIEDVGGISTDSLSTEETYTYWVATREAFESGQIGPDSDPFAFADTTVLLSYMLRGRSGGDRSLGISFSVRRDQTLTDDRYLLTWTPEDQPVRRVAIREGTLGGFTDMVWHVVQPEGEEDGILPPMILGQPPPGTVEAQEWLGFQTANYVLWTNTSDWDGQSFGFRTEGYAFFQIFANNFE
jgi:hypothetical protein